MQALIVIDPQYDFFPGGALPVPRGHEIIPVVNRLVDDFEHVVLTQDWHPAGHHSFASSHENKEPFDRIELAYGNQVLWPDHCIQGTPGAAFHSDLHLDKAELILRKGFRKEIDSYSAFFENDHKTPTGLKGYLEDRGIDTLYLAGLALDFCVGWSALDGRKSGYNVTVIEDASRGIDTHGSLDAALNDMHQAGVVLASSDRVVSARA